MKNTIKKWLPAVLFGLSSLAHADLGDIDVIETAGTQEKTGLHGMIGVAALSVPKYSGADDREISPLPLIMLDYNDTWYFHLNRAGVWAFKGDQNAWRLGLIARPYRERNSGCCDELDNTSDRDTSLGVGVAASLKLPVGELSADFVHDVLDNADGAWGELMYRVAILDALPKAQVKIGFGAQWLGSNVADYYYGITNSEAAPGRAAYDVDSTVNWKATLMGSYAISRSFTLMGGGGYTYFGDNIDDSPIVETSGDLVGFVGLGWQF